MKAALWGLLAVSPAFAQAPSPLERLRALAPPPPSAGEIYAEEMAADLALIAAEAARLFPPRAGLGPPAVIAVFTGPDCPNCAQALADLSEIAARLGLRTNVFDVSDPDNAAMMQRLGLDLLPSYVTPRGMFRGAMPPLVLERDLAN